MIHNRFNRFLFAEAVEGATGGGGGGAGTGDAEAQAAAAAAEGAAAGAGDPPARPDYIPEKYWKDGAPDVELLGKSYQELERKFHAARPGAADVPAAPDGYQLKPEKIPEGMSWSDEAATRFAETFHANGIPATAAKAITAAWMEQEEANFKQATETYQNQLKEARAALEKQWGGAEEYDKNMKAVAGLVTDTLGEDPNDVALFNNPRVLAFLAKVKDVLSEDAQAALKDSVASGQHFTSGAAEAKKIMSDATHAEHAAYLAGDPSVIAKVQRLLDEGK